MSKNRLDFQALLKTVTPNVYFQQPSNTNMVYPAIVYSIKDMDDKNANNHIYRSSTVYDVTVIDANPDSPIVAAIRGWNYCKYDRQFVVNGLNHTTFVIYY